jgi:T5SS/PEP-CTERM-associated repeat protein
MVQTNFSVGNAGSLATVLTDIGSGADSAINTAYTIAMTAGVSLAAAAVSLKTGSSVMLEGTFPFIAPAFQVTGTVVTDLNFTGTITLNNGVLDNPALSVGTGGIVAAGLFNGAVLGGAGDTAINGGTIQSTGTSAAIQFSSGTVQNGWNGSPAALISGVPEGVALQVSGLVQNGGTIIGTGQTSAAVFLGAGTVDNGQIGDTAATMSGVGTGVDIAGAGVINNDGSIIGVTYGGVYLGSGLVTNGQIGVGSALIDGGTGGSGVSIESGVGTVANFANIIGGGGSGVYLGFGGTVTNGAPSDPAALIDGSADGVVLLAAGSLVNYGTVLANGSDATQYVIGAFFDAGGTIENLSTSALVGGLEWGAVVEHGAGFVTNLGTIQALAASGLGVDLTAGGTVVNETAATIVGGSNTTADGVRISAGGAGAGAVVLNGGTIEGAVGVDFQSGTAEAAGTLTNNGLIESTSGASGNAVVFGTGAERLVLQSAGSFVGGVVGGSGAGSSTTLELVGGTQGTLSGLANNGGMVTDSAGSFVFSSFGTIALDAGASWTVVAPGSVNTLNNAGALGIAGGSVTVTGSLANSGSLAIGGATLTATTGVVADQGIITVGPGGLLKANGGGITGAGAPDIEVGGGASATLNVTGAGATVNTGGHQFGIGSSGQGSVLVSQGGTILAGTTLASDEAIYTGGSVGATGGLTVTDPGSLVRATGQFSVGLGGNGSLLIENQATVVTGNNAVDKSEGFDVGQLAGSSGDATVTGTNSLLSNTGRFVVGDAGLGSLSIQSGATVVTSPGSVAGLAGATIANTAGASGSSVNVAGAGSDWQVGGALDVGTAGTGLLAIDAGATVSATTLDAGVQSGSAGIVTVTGTNTDLTTTGSLAVGDGGSGELSILNGANVFIGGDLDIGQTAGGSGNVDIEDTTGTVYIGGNLNVGFGGPAALTLGLNVTVKLDNGIENFGPDASVIEYSFFDPFAVNNSASDTQLRVSGADQYTAYVNNTGGFEITSGHAVAMDTPIIFGAGGSFTIDPDAELMLNTDTVIGQTINFSSNSTLVIGTDQLQTIDLPPKGSPPFTAEPNPNFGELTIGGFHGTIAGFTPGDTIVVDTNGPATFSQNGSVVSVIESGSTLGVLTFATPQMATTAFTTPGALVDHALCFLAGTLITTPVGQTEVERLVPGDLVLTAGGVVRPVVWVGRGRVLATRGRRGPATPVIVRKGALGPNVPHADLRVTKGHSFFVDGVLIPVEFLVNHRSILWDDRAQEVSIYHVELQTHDVLLANGAPAESYRDDGNRWLFQNANSGWDLAPQVPCAPVLTGGAVVDAVWRRLLDRAGARPSVPLTDDPDLCLVVDGVRVDAVQTGDVLVFGVCGGASEVRVVSRAAAPQEIGVASDPRCLGVAVRRVVVRQGTRFRVVRGEDPVLAAGFHAFEPATGLRWTDGDAVLPVGLFDGFAGACEVVVHLGGVATYVDYGERMAVAGP